MYVGRFRSYGIVDRCIHNKTLSNDCSGSHSLDENLQTWFGHRTTARVARENRKLAVETRKSIQVNFGFDAL